MPATIFQGSNVKALKNNLDLNGVALISGDSAVASTIPIYDSNKHLVSSAVASSALGALTGSFSTQELLFANGPAITGSSSLLWTGTDLAITGNIQQGIVEKVQASTATLNFGSQTTVVSLATTAYNCILMNFGYSDIGTVEAGKVFVCTDGVSSSISVERVSTDGIVETTWTASVSGGNIVVQATMNSGIIASGTLTYYYDRFKA